MAEAELCQRQTIISALVFESALDDFTDNLPPRRYCLKHAGDISRCVPRSLFFLKCNSDVLEKLKVLLGRARAERHGKR